MKEKEGKRREEQKFGKEMTVEKSRGKEKWGEERGGVGSHCKATYDDCVRGGRAVGDKPEDGPGFGPAGKVARSLWSWSLLMSGELRCEAIRD